MSTETLTKRKWFWPWQDEQEESWLREMSLQGLHLQAVGLMGMYKFGRGEPQDYAYRLDYQQAFGKDLPSYYQLFRDAGWEHLGAMGGWQYFRKPAVEGEEPEIFTDAQSKIDKYQRVLRFFAVFLILYLVVFVPRIRDSDGSSVAQIVATAAGILYTVLILLYGYVCLRLLMRIKELKSRAGL